MSPQEKHKWEFRARFRRNAFGWRSQLAITRIREAVSEIKKVKRRDPLLAGEGAVLFLERLSPAIMNVDSSSGAIGNAVNKAIEELVPIIAEAPADHKVRDKWLDRLWNAIQEDEMPYIESLAEYWGDMCVSGERASRWADKFLEDLRCMQEIARRNPGAFYHYEGTTACFSSLLKAGRYEEMMRLLEDSTAGLSYHREWGVKALLAMGKKAQALRYAEESRDRYTSSTYVSRQCQEILLSSGLSEEAYNRYALDANWRSTYLATFREVVRKFPGIDKSRILEDLVESTPGSEGKWFAAAKWAGLYDRAIELANTSPCDPKTLTRAARDMAQAQPRFASEAGIAAIRWLVEGYGYEITGIDVIRAFDYTMQAAANAGCEEETFNRIRDIVSREKSADRFVARHLGRKLGLG